MSDLNAHAIVTELEKLGYSVTFTLETDAPTMRWHASASSSTHQEVVDVGTSPSEAVARVLNTIRQSCSWMNSAQPGEMWYMTTETGEQRVIVVLARIGETLKILDLDEERGHIRVLTKADTLRCTFTKLTRIVGDRIWL